MIKVVRTVKRRSDLSREQFKAYWLNNHSKLEDRVVAETPITRIVASFSTGDLFGGSEVPFDGMVELYFNTVEDVRVAFSGPVPAMMRRDEENFIDLSDNPIRAITEEHVMAPGEVTPIRPGGPTIKVARMVYRRPDFTREQFKSYWLNEHSKLERQRVHVTTVRRIVASFALGEVGGDESSVFDGMVELYFDSIAAAYDHFPPGAPSVMRDDEVNFADMSVDPVRVVMEEYVTAEK